MTSDTLKGKDHWWLSLSARPLGSTQSKLEWHTAEEKVQGMLGNNRKRAGGTRHRICSDDHMHRSSSFQLSLKKEKGRNILPLNHQIWEEFTITSCFPKCSRETLPVQRTAKNVFCLALLILTDQQPHKAATLFSYLSFLRPYLQNETIKRESN